MTERDSFINTINYLVVLISEISDYIITHITVECELNKMFYFFLH